MRFVIEGRPVGKARARTVRNKHTGKVHSYTPETTANYEDLIRWSYTAAGGVYMAETTLQFDIKAFYPLPKQFSKEKKIKAMQGVLRPTSRPDLDNCGKVVLDALNGVAYCDDKQVVEMSISKWYGDRPRLEVEINQL